MGMDRQERQMANFKSILQQQIQCIGIWDSSYAYGVRCAAKISMLAFILTNITQVIALFKTKGDPKALLACLSILSFCLMGLLKLVCLVTKEKNWRLLINGASSLEYGQLSNHYCKYDYDSDGEDDRSFESNISLYTKKYSTFKKYLTRIYNITVVIFMASPFVEFGLRLSFGKDVEKYPHILPGWAPLDFNVLGYIVTILAEIVAAVYCVRIHTVFDVTAIGFMIFIRGQFNLLHKYSERIGGKGEICNLSNRRDNRAHFRIKKCHHIHVVLLKSVNQLGKLIQNILGIYFFLATLTLCSVAVQLKSNQLSPAQLISLLQYMGATLTQLFLFCQYGAALFNDVRFILCFLIRSSTLFQFQSSVGLGEGPTCAACWCLSSRIRREIALLTIGMARPCGLLAGPLSPLDLPSFIQIVRTAYSYYAVLRQT